MQTIEFEVTQEDIDKGINSNGAFDGDYCPVARSLTRLFGAPVSVGWYGFYLKTGAGELGPEVVSFIRRLHNRSASVELIPFTGTATIR
jgi:hypothetical protein